MLAAAVRPWTPFTLACSALCVPLAATAFVRDAEWIVVLCVLAGAAVFVAGVVNGRTLQGSCSAGSRGRWPACGASRGSAVRCSRWPAWGAARPRCAPPRCHVLAVLVFGLLFASADALFAEWVDVLVPDLRVDTFVARAFLTVFVGGVVLARVVPRAEPAGRRARAGGPARPVAQRYEWLVPVLLVDAVFVVFLVAQATVIFGGHDYLEQTTGLTYAEYVHQGFGQLTVATALTLLVVWAAARKAPRATPPTWCGCARRSACCAS